MLRFFRQIRQRLLTGNKFSKYALYAVGEIVLIVIGILIAVQIDSWNEQRKLRSKELEILKEFKASLAKDATYLDGTKYTYAKAQHSLDYLIAYMEKDLPYIDSLKYHFANITFDWGVQYDFSTYEALKAEDVNLISNDSLRSNIIWYYSLAEGLNLRLANRYSQVIEHASLNLFSRHFDQMWEARADDYQGEMIPVDYEALKEDREFRYFLKTLRNQIFWLIEAPIEQSDRIASKVVDGLDREIERLSN